MATSTGRTLVHIWIGSEWPALRVVFTAYLDSLRPDAASVTVATESVDAESMPGRVAGWIRTSCAHLGNKVAIEAAGGAVTLPDDPAGMRVGVTELRLDPNPAQAEQLYAIGLWSRFVPRRKRWLMRVTPFLIEEIVENAAAARPDLLVQVAEWQGQRVIIAGRDLIAAEVVGRALRIITQPAGDVGVNPWETELVRIASERGLGVTSGPRIKIAIAPAGRIPPRAAAAFREVSNSIARMLDCEFEFGA